MITYILDNIAIGNSQDSKTANNLQFNAILNVAIDLDFEDNFKWRYKVGLLDGPGNEPLTFVSAVVLLHSLVKQGKKILVHCHEGKSRSVMVVATYLIVVGLKSSIDDALLEIMPLRNVNIYRQALYDIAQLTLPTIKEIVHKSYGENK